MNKIYIIQCKKPKATTWETMLEAGFFLDRNKANNFLRDFKSQDTGNEDFKVETLNHCPIEHQY